MKSFKGVFSALVTPLYKGEVDYQSLKSLLKFQLDGEIDGLVIHGTTGESPTLDKVEKKKVFEFVKAEVSGRVPLVVGTGTNNTREAVEATRDAEAWGADGVLVVVPYYNKPPQRGLVEHFKAIASASALPNLLYNVPSRTITSLEVDSIAQLSKVSNIVGIKEATGDMAFAKSILSKVPSDFQLLSGDDGTFLEFVSLGGVGVISVISNVLPREMVHLCRKMLGGDRQAIKDYDKYQKFTSLLFKEANPIPVKMALFLMGIIRSPEMRLPLVPLSDEWTAQLSSEMKELGLLK